MAKRKAAAAKAGDLARLARENPYIQRLIEDDQLRATLRDSYGSARGAFERLGSGKTPAARALLDDKKLQKQLKEAASGFRGAAETLRQGPPKRRHRGMKLLFVALVGAVAAVALNEGLRKKLLDALFGAEEEFDYTSNSAAPGSPEDSAAEKTTV